VTRLPRGFSASGIACGIKRSGLDLALFVSDRPAAAAARFTTNRFKAAPVQVSALHLRKSRGRARAVVVNSGCANAATGSRGLQAAERTALTAARRLGLDASQVLVASTGVIGAALPAGRIGAALPEAVSRLAPGGLPRAARAIMTTDTRPKVASARLRWRGRTATVSGCAKGAGMIHPKMATMLVFLFTDADVDALSLRRILGDVSPGTLESISVDGDTSTNDAVILLANGASGLRVRRSDASMARFRRAVATVAASLARQIVLDAEGARRTLLVEVRGAASRKAADRVARAVALSPLVKTALAGGDPNWGRILAAAGTAGVRFDPGQVSIAIGGVPVARRGAAVRGDPRRLLRAFKRQEVRARVHLGQGQGSARILTCDLTTDYVRINASYTS
jgi:glutamate N-acetyltransferase/amino-acid N-acetyltransferase